MGEGLVEVTEAQIRAALEDALLPKLAALLRGREQGHCMRVDDLDAQLAARLALALRTNVPVSQVYVLGGEHEPGLADVAVTSTKLVELRNPDEDNALRPPLLVFIPPGRRASAEDSFGVATFEQVQLDDVYPRIIARLLDEAPQQLRSGLRALLERLRESQWPWADDRATLRYLLTVRTNDFDPQVAGAAIYLLGLVPDFDLFTDVTLVRRKADRNRASVQKIEENAATDRQRITGLGLPQGSEQGRAFVRRLAAFAARTGLDSPPRWCRAIAIDRENWALAYNHWPQDQAAGDEKVGIEVHELPLPKAGDNKEDNRAFPVLDRLFKQPYLLPASLPSLKVTFRVEPDARQIPGLAKFSVQILAETESGEDQPTTTSPTGFSAVVSVRKTASSTYSALIRLKKAGKVEWAEGWHFVRVTPLDGSGNPMPVAGADSELSRPHESDKFYVVPEGEFDEPPTPRSRHSAGLAQAINQLKFSALAEGREPERVRCREVDWSAHTARVRTLAARFGPAGPVTIDLPPTLAELEEQILIAPQHLSGLSIAVTEAGVSEPTRDDTVEPSTGFGIEDFHAARQALFAQIRDAEGRAGHALLVEAADPRVLADAVVLYAQAYLNAVTRCVRTMDMTDTEQATAARAMLGLLLRTDTVTVDLIGSRDEGVRALLVSPTHPLRMLWFCGHAALADRWLDQSTSQSKDAVLATLRSLHERLTPLGFPLVVPLGDGGLAFAGSNLTDYWQIALPSDTRDPRSITARLASALNVIGASAAATAVSGADLADRVDRYIRLHPYVDTLVLNALNAGRGEVLTTMLLELQSRKHLAHLRYTIRLFADDPEEPWVAEALTDLFTPGAGPRLAAAEAFATPGDPLHPKLAVIVRGAQDLLTTPEEFPAHLTFLFDPFGGEQYDVGPSIAATGRSAVHGLVQELTSSYSEEDDRISWTRTPRHGTGDPLPDSEDVGDLLARLPAALSEAVAASTAGEPRERNVPLIRLELTADDRALLHNAHRYSDWVVTVDRTLGIEYFDHGRADRPAYVIDYSATAETGMGHHIVVSSRSVDELRALLGPVLESKELHLEARHVQTFFDQLRELSGSLAFKLAALGKSSRGEVLGLSLTRLYLERSQGLRNQILVPLDAHIELADESRRRIQQSGDAARLRRTDLALFDLDLERNTIVCHLVEVKCYSDVGKLHQLAALKTSIAEQLRGSERTLTEQFDPDRERTDRSLQNLKLRVLLRHYLDRADRYGLFTEQAKEEADWFLEHLDHGFTLAFTRTGLIFDLGQDGEETEHDSGIAFHRIGRDQIAALLSDVDTEYIRPRDMEFHARERTRELPVGPVTVPELDPFPAGEEPSGAELAGQAGEKTNVDEDAVSDDTPSVAGTAPSSGPGRNTPATAATEAAVLAQAITTAPDILLGADRSSPQFGILGEVAGRKIGLDLNETHTISLFGVQGGGKSYTLGSILEMACMPVAGINRLPSPLGAVLFHYSKSEDYAPEFTSMANPNSNADQLSALQSRYGALPAALSDIVLLTPSAKVDERRAEYPGIDVQPLAFASVELQAAHWRFLMGAVGNQSTYLRQLGRIMKANRDRLTLDLLRREVEASSLTDSLKQLAHQRLELAAEYIDDRVRLKELIRPGRLIIVDLRDYYIEKDDALGLFVVLMQLFADARHEGAPFNKLFVFDEAHQYIDSPDLVRELVDNVRIMRHKGMSIVVASQDPPSVPVSLIDLSDQLVLHKCTSPAWLKHLQKANSSLATLSPADLASLVPGEAFVWSGKATDEAFMRGAVKVRCRPRITQHGGATRTAVR